MANTYLLETLVTGIDENDPNAGTHYTRVSADSLDDARAYAEERGNELKEAYKDVPGFQYTIGGIWRDASKRYDDTTDVTISVPETMYRNDLNDRFADFFGRVIADIKTDTDGICGTYEVETAEMLRDAFLNADYTS